ncbi:MAG: hypothetical protein KTR22_01480 [Flavobacteriaceae bacterium]|nr:hypothetical protein [Flavobacteriaceae bacterium]
MKTQSIFQYTAQAVRFLFTTLLITILFLGCKDKASEKETPSEKETLLTTMGSTPSVHVAFAGGGWRAHTGHSAWTISLLENGTYSLGDVYDHVGTFSSNSGGSWFSTMLMYSSSFVSDIQAADAVTQWNSTGGWIGKQRALFDAAPCGLAPDGIYLECVFDHYTNKSYTGGTYWKLMVENLVFKSYPLGTTTLSDPHQSWAKDKPLLLASTLLTNAVVLNSTKDDENNQYYQACVDPSTPVLNGDSGSDCSQGRPVDVSAATFSSIPSGNSYQASPFLAELGTSKLNLGYTADFEFETAPKITKSVALPLQSDGVPVMTAAAASSAAAGFGASEHITGSFDFSWVFEDNAISFGLNGGSVDHVVAKGLSLTDLADKKVVRLADGGAADNSAVAQLVRSLQLNGQADGFNIVAFDNVSDITTIQGAANVGIDIASLFGYKDQLCVNLKLTKYCITTPNLQIFEAAPLTSTQHTWAYGTGSNQLVYTQYQITTKANPTLGIVGGTKGTLHSFTCAYPTAETAPIDGDTNFDAYANMFKFINDGLNDKSGVGLQYLRAALGL